MTKEIYHLNENYIRLQVRKNLIRSAPFHKVRLTVNERVSSGATIAGKLSGISVGNCEIEIPQEMKDLIIKFKGKSVTEIENELKVQYGLLKHDAKGVKGKDFIKVKQNTVGMSTEEKEKARKQRLELETAIQQNAQQAKKMSQERRAMAVKAIQNTSKILSTYLNITGMQSIVCVGISFVLKQMSKFALYMAKLFNWTEGSDPNPSYNYKSDEVEKSVGFQSSQYSVEDEIVNKAMKDLSKPPFNEDEKIDMAYPTVTLKDETPNIPFALFFFPNFSKVYIKDPTKRENILLQEIEKDKKAIIKDVKDLINIQERGIAGLYESICKLIGVQPDTKKSNAYSQLPEEPSDEYAKMLKACKAGAIISYEKLLTKSIKLYLKLFENDSSPIAEKILRVIKEIELAKNNLTSQ